MLSLERNSVIVLYIFIFTCLYHCANTITDSGMKGLTGEGALAVVTSVSTLYLFYLLIRNGIREEVTLGEAGEFALWFVVLVNIYRCIMKLRKHGLAGHGILCVVSCAASVYLLLELLMNDGM